MAWKRTLKDGTTRWEDKVYHRVGDGYRTQTIRGRTRAEVLRLKAKALADRERKPTTARARPSMTLGELGEQFVTRHVRLRTPSTQGYYLTALRYRVAQLYPVRLRDLDRATIDEWLADLHAEAVVDDLGVERPKHSPRQINAALSTLKVMLAKAVEWGMIEQNPADRIPKLKERKREIRVYPPDQVERLAAAMLTRRESDHRRAATTWAARDAAMVVVMAFTGVRLGELLGLQWDDIGDGWLRVERAVDVRTGATTQTKTFRSRSVPVLEPTARAFQWLAATMPPPSPSAPIFPSNTGGRMRQNTYRERVFRPGAQLAGLPDARPHELRHTFASLMIARGVTPLRLSKWMGHSDPVTTMRVYAHLFDRVEDDILDRVNAGLYAAK